MKSFSKTRVFFALVIFFAALGAQNTMAHNIECGHIKKAVLFFDIGLAYLYLELESGDIEKIFLNERGVQIRSGYGGEYCLYPHPQSSPNYATIYVPNEENEKHWLEQLNKIGGAVEEFKRFKDAGFTDRCRPFAITVYESAARPEGVRQ